MDDGTEDASRVTASAYTRQDATLSIYGLSVSLVSKKQRYIQRRWLSGSHMAIWYQHDCNTVVKTCGVRALHSCINAVGILHATARLQCTGTQLSGMYTRLKFIMTAEKVQLYVCT